MSFTKYITAMILALAILLTMASCNGGTNTPAQTPVGSDAPIAPPETTETVVTTGGASPSPTETVTTASVPALPEFDLNSEECLMYRLLDMTYGELLTEFGEESILSVGSNGNGTDMVRFRSENGNEYFIPYSYLKNYEDNPDNSIESNIKKAFEITKPDYVSINIPDSPVYDIYPGINIEMTTAEVFDVIGEWDYVCMISNGTVRTLSIVDEYLLTVVWEITDDNLVEKIKKETDGKSREEQKLIRQNYADEFIENPENQSARVYNVEARKDFEDYLEAIKNS